MALLKKVKAWLDGNKTYIGAIAVATLGLLETNGVTVPPWVYSILAAWGIVAVRSVVKKFEK